MSMALTIVIVVTAGLAVLLLLIGLIAGMVRRRLAAELTRRLPGRRILLQAPGASFFGLEARGVAQIRGNGALVLTPDELFFLMAVPRREIRIPLTRIAGVSLVRSHLGKTVFRNLLRVDFHGEEGNDAAAWAVRDPDGWRRAIEGARRRETA